MFFSFSFLLFLFLPLSIARAEIDIDRLAADPAWHKLLHYRKAPTGFRSEIDGEEFFLSPEGKTSPESELRATLAAFRKEDGEARCRYPARWIFLRAYVPTASPRICPAYERFKVDLEAQGVSLVFSSYFMNHPASAFGHTFLKFRRPRPKNPGRYDLLDYGVNFAAVVNDESPLEYGVKGLFGGFEGRFTRLPYYYKVREYNDYEARDLWEYELAFTPGEVERLVAHLWELGPTHFDYFYLSENCAYQILALLEAARPSLDLTRGLPAFVIPIETVKRVVRVPGLVVGQNFRPSLRAQFGARTDALSGEAARALSEVIDEKNLLALNQLSTAEAASVLDAAADYEDLHHFKELHLEPRGEHARWKGKLLASRSRLAVKSTDVAPVVAPRRWPHLTHGLTRVGVDAGTTGREFFSGVGFRLALHDLLDSPVGYSDAFGLKILETRARIWNDGPRFTVDSIYLFDLISLNPRTEFSKKLSWEARLGGKTFKDSACERCFGGVLETGVGPAWRIAPSLVVAAFVDAEINVAPTRVSAGPHLFALFQSEVATAQLGVRYRIRSDLALYAEARFFVGDTFAVGLRSEGFPRAWEHLASLYVYF